MYPHERSLVKELKDKPFALIGVNSDPKETLKEVIKTKDISWRSFWDGGDTSGPIATKWNVSGWPTIYVLDAEGVIHYKGHRPEEMDKAIEKLLAEMEDGKDDDKDK